jgi:5-methylcytosine-specific restriction protein B
MDKYELANILKDMYNNAKDGEKVAMIHLFGMEYGDKIKEISSFKEMAQLANIQDSYATEISKGSKISDVSKLKQFNYKNTKSNKMNFLNIKNIILYGAPGVGKTHNYKNLISMIEEGKNQKEIFDTIAENRHVEIENEIYETIKQEKRVEFVTFHQSYSYEDFIEGFRPNESGNIELEDGIFKRFSLNALNKIKESVFQHISFDEAYDILRTAYINEELETLKTVTNVDIVINDFKEKSLSVQTVNAKDSQYVKKHDLETVVNAMLKNLVSKPSDIRQLEVKKDTFSLSGYYFSIGNKIVEIIKNHKINVEKEQNFYIVIDEINRGNISKIFGELITLIEEDKRDIYEVTLPYSKEKFKVPSNLYIIATMNSTDKSIATIDIALRRRFTFLKMMPNKTLVPDIAKDLFEAINKFIRENLNEDYQLGHSYFMKIANDEDLEFVKKYKIKPLLEEYFYVDKTKLDEVLTILNIENSNE